VLSDSNARLASARRLTSRRARRETGHFLAEGAQAVREALRHPEVVVELFVTASGRQRNAELLTIAADVPVSQISDKAAAALSETVTPQGLIAVCRMQQLSLDLALAKQPTLVAVLVEANDPGNAGAILRTADAAGAELVVFAADSVDVYNGKAVRASAGSLFHLDVISGLDVGGLAAVEIIKSCRAAGLTTFATTGSGSLDSIDLDELIDDGRLAAPTAWIFGNEARGLPAEAIDAADFAVRVPIHGQAESLNLAAAAAICLYASAGQQRRARSAE
jgi:TrmH family RNA methyltransferase